jgi:hypothetical protein
VQPHGWMSTGTFSSSARAQNGSSSAASSSRRGPAVEEICTPRSPVTYLGRQHNRCVAEDVHGRTPHFGRWKNR